MATVHDLGHVGDLGPAPRPGPPRPAPRRSVRRRVPVGGIAVDVVDTAGAAELVVAASQRAEGGIVVTPNLDHLHKIRRIEALRAAYTRAALVLADGTPLLWASRLQGTPLPERVAGSDFLWSVADAAQGRTPIYLLGGRPTAAGEAARRLLAAYPGLEIVGTSCPPNGFEGDPRLVDREVDELCRRGPGVVFVGLGCPKQEILSLQLAERLPGTWFVAIGGAIDMAAGLVQRAPAVVQQAGMEWLYRLVQEPRRLSRRYLVDDLPMAGRLFSGAARRRVVDLRDAAASVA